MSDLIIPYVIHWDGEPEPDLSGIDDPIRVPFRFVPAYTGGSERLATPSEGLARLLRTVGNASTVLAAASPD